MKCKHCDGTGGSNGLECPFCDGSGTINQTNEEWFDGLTTEQKAEWLGGVCHEAEENHKLGNLRFDYSKEFWSKWLKEKHNDV